MSWRPEGVDRGRKRRPEDFEAVEADEFLLGALGVVGADLCGGLQRAAEATAGLHSVAGDALDLALVACEERDEQVGLMKRPGAEDDGFAVMLDLSALGHG